MRNVILIALLLWSLVIASAVFMVGNKYYDISIGSTSSSYVGDAGKVVYVDSKFYFNAANWSTWTSYGGVVGLSLSSSVAVDSLGFTAWMLDLHGSRIGDSMNVNIGSIAAGDTVMSMLSDSVVFVPALPGIMIRLTRVFSEADSVVSIKAGVICR